MNSRHISRSITLALTGLLALVSTGSISSASAGISSEVSGVRQQNARASVEVEVSGVVVGATGEPSPGAVVVTSAGGHAVTGAGGEFLLEVLVGRSAEHVLVTAVGAGSQNLIATKRVQLAPASFRVLAGTLELATTSSCNPRWLPTFGSLPGTAIGLASEIHALQVFDDGNGPALYAAGDLGAIGGVLVSNIARWDGAKWSRVGAGDFGGTSSVIKALGVFDDGSGPALFAGGEFDVAGGVPARRIAKWDGATWSALGAGLDDGVSPAGSVEAISVYDDGTGDALIVGGSFQKAGAITANQVARWDGASWSALGSGMDGSGEVLALLPYDDGSGTVLVAGGDFTSAGGASANCIATWDGSSWTELAGGVVAILGPASVRSLAVHDDGTGASLYVGGRFAEAGAFATPNVAQWNGVEWLNLSGGLVNSFGNPTNVEVNSLVSFDAGEGVALYAGGTFLRGLGEPVERVARWDGSSWSEVAGGIGGSGFSRVNDLAVFDGGEGPELVAAGRFEEAGDSDAHDIARWNGSNWRRFGDGLNDRVEALAVFDDGSGPALHAAGLFTVAGEESVDGVAKWTGSEWVSLGGGVNNALPSFRVYALEVYDDGSGEALYAGGLFSFAGGEEVNHIAKWDGTSWSALAGGVGYFQGPSGVRSLAVYDDGRGEALYVGGSFTAVDGQYVRRIARWDGSGWEALGRGVDMTVWALVTHDDGSGPQLYAAGDFTTAGNKAASRVARWDGTDWNEFGGGVDDTVRALAVWDRGSGPELYAGGDFSSAGGTLTSFVAKWDGANWEALGSGMDGPVHGLTAHDDGSGSALFATGSFGVAGGAAAYRIAKWDGTSWSALGLGLGGTSEAPNLFAAGYDLLSFDDGTGAGLYVGGRFELANTAGDCHLGKWGEPEDPGLTADVASLSLASGGQQVFTLDAGSDSAGWFYVVLGAVTGTAPGTDFGSGVVLPLNADAYFTLTATKPGLGAFSDFRGMLDGTGQAQATLNLPALADPSLVGVVLHHAYLAGSTPGTPEYASCAVALELVP